MMVIITLIGASSLLILLCFDSAIFEASAFVPQINLHNSRCLLQKRLSSFYSPRVTSSYIFARSSDPNGGNSDTRVRKVKKKITLRDYVQRVVKDTENTVDKPSPSKKMKSKRTRKRTSAPKQTYLYEAQRKALGKTRLAKKITEGKDEDVDYGEDRTLAESPRQQPKAVENRAIELSRRLGMNLATQFSLDQSTYAIEVEKDGNPITVNASRLVPQIVGKLLVGGDEDGQIGKIGSNTGRFAYVIDKPAGWSILDNNKKKKSKRTKIKQHDSKEDFVVGPEVGELEERTHLAGEGKESANVKQQKKRVKYFDDAIGKFEWMEYNELDILSLMTPQEAQDFFDEGGFESLDLSLNSSNAQRAKKAADGSHYKKNESVVNTDTATVSHGGERSKPGSGDSITSTLSSIPTTTATFLPPSRPSLVQWLKDTKSAEGITVRGGNNWKALAGAVDVDDSGLVLLCPKDKEDCLHIDQAEYIAVVGNGKFLAPRGKKIKGSKRMSLVDNDESTLEVISKVRKGRGDDSAISCKVSIPDGSSTCNDAVQLCQKKYQDGIRGDPAANPLDRRASRRLVHCSELSVSSLSQDDFVNLKCELPDDIRLLSDRRNHHEFENGSFLGRRHIKGDDFTTAYREINGAADGFPGWIVDRYGQWLLVQHEEDTQRGPLPSIHDGNTSGIYYFSTTRDRSVMSDIKPNLIEGQAAPDMVEIKENGIVYYIKFEDLSTGIFLDQRPQRAWLARHCTENTRVLNCFSHCGAFSVAAATTGAQTVSLDLSKKWLDRIEPQMKANGIDDFSERHDCIYGDCFDWLARLAKRGEKYDIVILDPPSTSVGGKKKKRWSAKNDYDELVTLASKLVKSGGLLWTTTNSAAITPISFAHMCEKGLINAGITNAKLERVAPMPIDFPTIGSPPVKNFVWRFQ